MPINEQGDYVPSKAQRIKANTIHGRPKGCNNDSLFDNTYLNNTSELVFLPVIYVSIYI